MAGIFIVILTALLASTMFCIPEERLKRSYENSHRDAADFGIGSEEHDASLEDHAPCGLLEDNSGSPERGYDFDEPPNHDRRRGFSVKAAAAASSSSYT